MKQEKGETMLEVLQRDLNGTGWISPVVEREARRVAAQFYLRAPLEERPFEDKLYTVGGVQNGNDRST